MTYNNETIPFDLAVQSIQGFAIIGLLFICIFLLASIKGKL